MPKIGQITPFSKLPTGVEAMKTTFALMLSVLLLLFSACSQKVNDPADVQAIKTLLQEYSKAATSGDVAAIVANYFTEDAISHAPNSPKVKGKDAIVSSWKTFFDIYTPTLRSVAEEVWVSGDLAGARGTYTSKLTPKTSGAAIIEDQGKWTALYRRQPDGSWRCFADTWNSDLPVGQVLSSQGVDEQALLQIERDWAAANPKNDAGAVGKYLADDFVQNFDGRAQNKKQTLAEIKTNPAKIESAANSDMRAMVFENIGVVNGLYAEKSTTKGKNTTGQYRWTDVFVKRDGQWQCVTSYVTKASVSP
jgi:uncharacterized protein (TIGR02246 family)